MRLIDEHIDATGAVTPNPIPTSIRRNTSPETIGVQPGGLRVAGQPAKPAPKAKPPVHTTVGGWRSGGTCSIRLKQGSLVINSTGGDPFVHVAELKAQQRRSFHLSVRIKSNAAGDSVVFYNKSVSSFENGSPCRSSTTASGRNLAQRFRSTRSTPCASTRRRVQERSKSNRFDCSTRRVVRWQSGSSSSARRETGVPEPLM
jgi:hypothetical protein